MVHQYKSDSLNSYGRASANSLNKQKATQSLDPPPLQLQVSKSSSISTVPIQRKVIQDVESGKYYSTKDNDREEFDTKSEARAHEKKIIAELMKKRKRAPDRGQKPPGFHQGAQKAPKKGISKSPNVDYPERALTKAEMEYQGISNFYKHYDRSGHSPAGTIKEDLIDYKQNQDKDRRTQQDEAMIAAPKQNMTTAGININHKLADSSVATIVFCLWKKLKDANEDLSSLSIMEGIALVSWVNSLSNSNDAYATFAAGLNDILQLDDNLASQLMDSIIAPLSNGLKNVRFGDAKTNLDILYGFDANVKDDGTHTPHTSEIIKYTQQLASSGLIPASVIAEALTPSKKKATGEAMSSSRQQSIN